MAKPIDASELGRQLSALRKHHGGGGSKRRIPHDAGIPIGSTETIQKPYKRYRCVCVDCRIFRGHKKPAPDYTPPDPKAWMTAEARSFFAAMRKRQNSGKAGR